MRGRGFLAVARVVLRVEGHGALAVRRPMGGRGGCFASEVALRKENRARGVGCLCCFVSEVEFSKGSRARGAGAGMMAPDVEEEFA